MNRKILHFFFGMVGSATLALAGAAAAAPDDGPVAQKPVSKVNYEAWYAKNASKIANRNALVGTVMQNLHADLQRMGASIEEKARLQVMLHNMPTAALERTLVLTKVAEVEAVAMGAGDALGGSDRFAVQTKELGDITQDLVFIPHGPCRIVDTRGSASGAIPGGTARSFKNFSATGQGTTTSCNTFASGTGIGYTAGSGGAIAITVTGVPPGATGSLYGNGGFLTARPVGDTNVTATVLIQQGTPFTAANSTIIKTSIGVNDFEVYAAITSHVVVDVLGFYVPAAPSALDCTTVTVPVAVPAGIGQSGSATATCPAGYAITGAGAFAGPIPSISISKFNYGTNSVFCRLNNDTASAQAADCQARCCRTPGSTTGRF